MPKQLIRLRASRYLAVGGDTPTMAWLLWSYSETGDLTDGATGRPITGTFWAAAEIPDLTPGVSRDAARQITEVDRDAIEMWLAATGWDPHDHATIERCRTRRDALAALG